MRLNPWRVHRACQLDQPVPPHPRPSSAELMARPGATLRTFARCPADPGASRRGRPGSWRPRSSQRHNSPSRMNSVRSAAKASTSAGNLSVHSAPLLEKNRTRSPCLANMNRYPSSLHRPHHRQACRGNDAELMEIMRRTSFTNYRAERRRRECNNLPKAVLDPLVSHQVVCV